MTSPDPTRPPENATQPGAPSEESDISGQILARLRTHGAKSSRYLARGEVARGGMGLILRVWDEDLRRELAMKVVLGADGKATTAVPPKVLGRFLEEAQVTGQLDHPGIVPVHELGLDDEGAVFFTMRLVKGRDLKEIFDRVKAGDPEWTLTRVLWVMLKVCDAMAYAHSKGVIHRDLKPANVMVGRFGEVYVMDWGLARVLGRPDKHDLRLRREDASLSVVQSERRADASHSADSVLFTMDGDVVGTPAYMAPEQARGEIERLGPRSDVYSVGAMLYQLLTGEMPFVARGTKVSQHMVLRFNLEGPPKPIRELAPGVSDELAAIAEKAMARAPEERYADMGELGEDLRAYLEDRVVRAHGRGAWLELKKWVRRNRKLAVAWASAAGVALLGLSATLFVQVRERRAAEAARAQADENLAEAQRQEAIARRERSNVLRLSAFQELDDLTREADALWPATPGRIPELEAWLARARRLVAGLDPSADGSDSGHRACLAELAARAHEVPADERARILASHPAAAALARAERKVASLRAAAEVRAGRAQPGEAELDVAALPDDPDELNERAFALVDPARTEFGRELEGLELARMALVEAADEKRFLVEDTLAWALFAVGLDEEARDASRDALEHAPSAGRQTFEERLSTLLRAMEAAGSGAGEAALRAAEAELAAVEREIFGPRFASQDDRWWFEKLQELVRAIEAFAEPVRGLVSGVASPHGWGVERRADFARTLEERTLRGPAALEAWALARATIRDPARSPAYAGLDLAPQLGLLPIGADPDSGLYEFADLATGEPPRRAPSGRLELGGSASVVFVLLPGGPATLGAQSYDPQGLNYDPAAQADESPVHTVELAPFFLSKYELTQGQWRRFTGANPSKHLSGTAVAGRELDDLSPVEQVSWLEASRVLARLGWQLPTEAQWEYAARAGGDLPWWTGAEPDGLEGAANLSDRFARRQGASWRVFEDALDDGYLVQAPVGSFRANPFGLHDVIGNVYEWCSDHPEGYDSVSGSAAEHAASSVPTRAVRGGSYVSAANGARASKRDSGQPELENESIGLRPARALAP